MKTTRTPLVAAAIAFAALVPLSLTPVHAADPQVKDAVADGLVVSVVGEITAIDAPARVVTIRGPQGNVGVFDVDPAVKNLDQVKVGDRVHIDYRAAVALALVKNGDGIREKVEAESATTSKPGDKPGGSVAKTTTLVATVVSVDKKQKSVKLKGPEGRVADVHVHDPKVLNELKAGDEVVAKVAESLAIQVRPAPKK